MRVGASLVTASLMSVCMSVNVAGADGGSASSPTHTAATSGVHGFDFEFGEWRVQHRVRRQSEHWVEFTGTCTTRPLMNGMMNVEDHKFDRPTGITHGVALRAFDEKTGQWAIWWVDSRNPHAALDPPVVGRFENGVGTFYADGLVDGKQTRTRFIWSKITATSAHWEQAFSYDGGKTWDTNWYMDFQRTGS